MSMMGPGDSVMTFTSPGRSFPTQHGEHGVKQTGFQGPLSGRLTVNIFTESILMGIYGISLIASSSGSMINGPFSKKKKN